MLNVPITKKGLTPFLLERNNFVTVEIVALRRLTHHVRITALDITNEKATKLLRVGFQPSKHCFKQCLSFDDVGGFKVTMSKNERVTEFHVIPSLPLLCLYLSRSMLNPFGGLYCVYKKFM